MLFCSCLSQRPKNNNFSVRVGGKDGVEGGKGVNHGHRSERSLKGRPQVRGSFSPLWIVAKAEAVERGKHLVKFVTCAVSSLDCRCSL